MACMPFPSAPCGRRHEPEYDKLKILRQTPILPLAVFWNLLRSGRMLTAAEAEN